MDYKKKYKEALERAKVYHTEGSISDAHITEVIFPELKESEDEKIRKELIENFKWFCGDYPETTKWGKDDDLLVKDIIAWLEKQGEKKLTENAELQNYISNVTCLVDQLKRDFGAGSESGSRPLASTNYYKFKERR